MSCTQKQQLVCFPKVRVYKPWFRHFNDHKDFRNEGTVHLFSLMALFSYANFRSNERVINGDRYMEAPGQWICKLGALPRILRVHSKTQALELMEYFQNHGFLTFEILDEEKEILRFTIADWKEHCTHLQYNYYSYKGSGFFFFPLPVGRLLLKTARKEVGIVFSELDAIMDMWLHTILNDPKVRGSEYMPVVYYSNMRGNEIDLELPGKQKCAYFCIVSDQDSTFDFLSSLFFSFLFIRLIRYADGYCEGGMLSTKVKFVLDEFPNCCLIPDFTKKCSTIRSRGCSVAVFFQNVGQMRNRYPDDQWQEILGACDSTVFLGCTDMLTAEYFSDRIGTASVEVEGTMRELNTMHITNYTPRFRKTNSLGRRQLLTPDEVLRLPPDQVLIFIRGQKVMRAKRYDYSLHPDYKKLKSRKAILHEPDWKTSQASSVSATGPSPSSSMATPVEKGSGNRQKKPPAKPARNTEREVVNADDIF